MHRYFAGKQRNVNKPKRTFKLKRAQQKHINTLKDIAEQQRLELAIRKAEVKQEQGSQGSSSDNT